jgi:hypothetical protein
VSSFGAPDVPYAPGPSPPIDPSWAAPPGPPRRRRPTWVPWLAIALAAILAVGGTVLLLSRSTPPPSPPSNVELTTEAIVDVVASVSTDGVVYLLCSEGFSGLGPLILYQTSDGGATWSNHTLTSIPVNPPTPAVGSWKYASLMGFGATLVLVLGSGELALPAENATTASSQHPAFYEPDASIIEVFTSDDGGGSWSSPAVVQEFNATIDSMSAANDGALMVVAWSTYNDSSGALGQEAATSGSGGVSWNPPQNLSQLGPTPENYGTSVVQVVSSEEGFDLAISPCGPDCSTDAPSFVAYAPYVYPAPPDPFHLIGTLGPWTSAWLIGNGDTGGFLVNTTAPGSITIASASSAIGPSVPFPDLPSDAQLSVVLETDGSVVITGGSYGSLVISSWVESGYVDSISGPSNVTVALPAPWVGWTPGLSAIVSLGTSWVAAYEWFHCSTGPVVSQCKGPPSALLLVGYPITSGSSSAPSVSPAPGLTAVPAPYVRLRGSP